MPKLSDIDLAPLKESVLLWLPAIAAAIGIGLCVAIANWALRRILRSIASRAKLDQTLMQFLETLLRYSVWTIGVVAVLGQLGFDVTSLVASMGVVGLTLGFAARDALSNVISGLFIFWDRPFVIGDLVEIDGHYGRVDQITMRSTRVVTTDGRMLAIPNATVVNSTVASYTNFPNLRLEIDITVGVDEDLGRIRALLLDLVTGRPGHLLTPAPAVVVTALNDYNIAIQLRSWIENEKDHLGARFRLREDALEVLRQAKVVMPYETLEVRRA